MTQRKTIDVSATNAAQKETNINNKSLDKKLTKQQQKQLQSMFDQGVLHNYFSSAQNNVSMETLNLAASLYANKGTKQISQQIRMGTIQINQQSETLDRQFLKRRISHQQQKTLQLKHKKIEIQQRLKYLQLQTSLNLSSKQKDNPELGEEFKPPNVLSKEQHQQYIQKIIKSRQNRDKKHEEYVKKLENSIILQEQNLKKLKLQKTNKQKEKRRKDIEKSLQLKKQQHKKILEQELKSRQQYKKVKNKQFLHQKIQEKYQSQVLIPALQQKKKKLKQIREMSKAFDVKELIKHQKQYIQKRNQSFSTAKSKVNQQWTYKPPEKKERLSRILQEQKQEQRRKLQEKKRLIDQKIQRQNNFVQYLKQKFSPTVDQNKQKQIQQRLHNQSKPKRKQSTIDSRTIGISYLQQAKKLKKQKTIQRPQTQKISQNSIQIQSSKGMTDYLSLNRKQKQYYEKNRRKRLQHLINSQNSSEVEKITKLRRQNQKINQAYSRKTELAKLKKQDINQQDDALELLLSGIKAKMGIINLYNHGRNKSENQTL